MRSTQYRTEGETEHSLCPGHCQSQVLQNCFLDLTCSVHQLPRCSLTPQSCLNSSLDLPESCDTGIKLLQSSYAQALLFSATIVQHFCWNDIEIPLSRVHRVYCHLVFVIQYAEHIDVGLLADCANDGNSPNVSTRSTHALNWSCYLNRTPQLEGRIANLKLIQDNLVLRIMKPHREFALPSKSRSRT